MTGLAGGLFAQSFGTADAYMGIGVVIVGFASVILGTSLIPSRSILGATCACLIGAIVYRFAVAISLNGDYLGLVASDVQLITAVIVVLALYLQRSGMPITRQFKRIRKKLNAQDYKQQEQLK
jgi:putative ABC transport system permease protein